MKTMIARLSLLPLFGLVVAGCSAGSGSAASGLASSTSGVASATRAPAGYGWTQGGAGAPGTAVSAIAALPSGTLVAEAPGQQVVLLDGATRSPEGGFAADVHGLVTHQGVVFAATAGAAGDVWRRTAAGWQLALDGPGSHAAVAEAGGMLHAVVSDGAGGATVNVLGATGWLLVGALPDATPTAAAPFGIDLWVGAERAQGTAGLFRVSGGVLTEVALPVSPVMNARQRVTALAPLSDALAIAVATFDAATGQALGGHVLLWSDPAGFQGALDLAQDAPLSLVKQDGTLYVGTDAGRLLYRTGTGLFADEPGLPANGGVTALLAPDAATLLVGVEGANGAEVLRRTPLAAGTGTGQGTGTGGAPDYLHAVKPTLAARCAGCHATMATGWRVSAGMTSDQADYQATLVHVRTTAPDTSPLLQKCANTTPHGGGAALPAGTPEYLSIQAWIAGGAPFDTGAATGTGTGAGTGTGTGTGTTTGTGTVTPPAGVVPDYVHEAVAVLSPRCGGCHSTMTTGWRVSAGMTSTQADYTATLPKVNTGAPASSLLLTKGSGQGHSGGAPLPAGSPEYAVLLAWIQNGAQYDVPRAGGATTVPAPTVPANPTYLRDVKPILFSCVGCHTSEDPRLSPGLTQDSADYSSVLRKVDTASPSSSELLRKPSSTNDHPVQVFSRTGVQYQTLLRWVQQGAKFN